MQVINYCRASNRTGVGVWEGRPWTNRFVNASLPGCSLPGRARAGPGCRRLFIATSGAVTGLLLMLGLHTHPINNYVTLFVEFILIWSFVRICSSTFNPFHYETTPVVSPTSVFSVWVQWSYMFCFSCGLQYSGLFSVIETDYTIITSKYSPWQR